MRAEIRKKKILIFDLYPFVLVVNKDSRLVRKITRTCVFVEFLVSDIVIPVPISKVPISK
jgi:hypothetical protein